jgi:carboxyl-terminal processing protease
MNTSDKRLIYGLAALPVVVLAFFLGLYVGEEKTQLIIPNGFTASASTSVSNKDLAPFWKAWNILNEKFVGNSTTTDAQKIYGAIEGLAASYNDPYTVFFPPVEAKQFKEEISGNFEGVGMEIGVKDGKLVVISPIKNSPADKAGVKSGDRVLAIDDVPSSEMPVDKAVKLIRGTKGTVVKLLFLPVGTTKPVEKSITRDVIDIPTIDTSTKPGGIFVIRLYSFTANSSTLFRNALREFASSGSHKLVLDLRGNPGGYLESAVDMASWFLPSGEVVVIEDFGKNGKPKEYRSRGYDVFSDDLKMIILVDGGSASASEILAGALQEHGVAKLVGTETFGKGSVQELVPITSDTSLKVTIARWLTPKGHNLSAGGLKPDYEVKVTEKDLTDKKDPQLDKALELLAGMK